MKKTIIVSFTVFCLTALGIISMYTLRETNVVLSVVTAVTAVAGYAFYHAIKDANSNVPK